MRSIDAQEIKQTAQVLVVGERSLHYLCPTEASHVVADDPVAVGEGRDLTLPHPAVRDPRVYEDQRLPFSRDFVVHPCAVDVGRTCLPKHLFPFPNVCVASNPIPSVGGTPKPGFFTFSTELFSGDASVALMGQGQYK